MNNFATNSQETNQENLFWADAVRAFAILQVIIIHVSAGIIKQWGAIPQSWWLAGNIYSSLGRGCVPLFIMLSGALLLPKRESYKDFFFKRFNRIAIPFITWSIVFLFWRKRFGEPELTLLDAVLYVVGPGAYSYFWFLYLIVGIYLITPIFRIVIAYASKRDLSYFLSLWFIVMSVCVVIEKFGTLYLQKKLDINLPVPMAEGFIGYFVLGYFLRQYATRKLFFASVVIGLLSLLVTIVGTYFVTRHFGSYDAVFYENFMPNIIFYCCAIFVFVKNSAPLVQSQMSSGLKNLVIAVSKTSFGIYFIHPIIFLSLAYRCFGFVLRPNSAHPVYMIPLITMIVFALSFCIVFLIQKIPYLKKIV